MKVINQASGVQTDGATPAQTASQATARERAIAKMMTPIAQAIPQPTSAEDMPKLSAEPAPSAQIRSTEEATPSVESEPAAETKAPSAPEEKPLSSEYAVLARKERAIRQREQQLKAREAEIRAKEEASRAPAPTPTPAFDESKYISKQKLAESPFEALADLGLSYEQLTEMAMNAPKPEQVALQNELKALRDEIKALKGDNESTKKSFAEQQTQAYNQAITQIRNEARSLVRSNPEFETIRGTNSVNDVVELIEQTFKEDGVLLTVEEAAVEVENYLVEEALKLAKLNKIQRRLQPKASAPAAKTTGEPKQQQLKTLTNSVASSRPLSAKERAVLAFEGKLNK